MPYSDKAKERRRCTFQKPDGSPCRAWALWGDERQLCVQHAGRGHRGKFTGQRRSERTHYKPCTCPAYAWPHRPGGGVCRWPDEPTLACATPASTHSWPRLSPWEKQVVRLLQRRRRWPRERAREFVTLLQK